MLQHSVSMTTRAQGNQVLGRWGVGGGAGGRGVKGGAGEGGGHHPWLVPASLYEVRRKSQKPAANKCWLLHTLVLEGRPRVGTYQLEYGCISIDKVIAPLVFLCLLPLPFTFPVTQRALYS